MKKLCLLAGLAVSIGLTSDAFADVQNIRLSGDIRVRGYLLDNAADLDSDTDPNEDSFISQRTRVTVEADLEDHVLAVVTLKAEGLWGSTDATAGSGAGSASGSRIDRGFDLGLNEAYVQLNEVFYTSATLKLGRQFLNYGRGLIISSVDYEYNFDAARIILDQYPLTIEIVGAKALETSAFGPGTAGSGDADLLFVNSRYEMSDSIIKDIEAYFGWLAQNGNAVGSSAVPPSAAGASPLIIGLRSDINITEDINTWFEAAYEFGSAGTGATDDISAWLLNAGVQITMKDIQWVPIVNASWTYASGGANSGDNFIPWFDYAQGQNGYVFSPMLSNIHIINVGTSIKPSQNTTLALQGYYYTKVDEDGPAGGNGNIDFGGLPTVGGPSGKDLGLEIDTILGYDYSSDVHAQLVYGVFIPDNAYTSGAGDSAVNVIRGEVNVRF